MAWVGARPVGVANPAWFRQYALVTDMVVGDGKEETFEPYFIGDVLHDMIKAAKQRGSGSGSSSSSSSIDVRRCA